MDRLIVILYFFFISFVCLILSRIAKDRRRESPLIYMAILGFTAVAFLTGGMDMQSAMVVMGFLILSLAVAELIARSILKRRIITPRVRVKRSNNSNIPLILIGFVVVSSGLYPLIQDFQEILIHRCFGTIVPYALAMTTFIIIFALAIFEKIEICGNGVWDRGRLSPWYEYASFEWHETDDKVELKLWSKSWLSPPRSTRLSVPPGDRETVHQWLEANLPELSATSINA
jgi:hypothetical protein